MARIDAAFQTTALPPPRIRRLHWRRPPPRLLTPDLYSGWISRVPACCPSCRPACAALFLGSAALGLVILGHVLHTMLRHVPGLWTSWVIMKSDVSFNIADPLALAPSTVAFSACTG
eukprot:589198-Pyramimonas_sp.AAC.1